MAEDLPDNSSGACDSVFSGNTDVPDARRALMQFDVSQIPAGAVINSVTLSMTVTRGSNHVDSTFSLHPVNATWVEGGEGCGVRGGGQGEPSTGGVTWNTQPGFGEASGSTLVNSTAPVWSGTGVTDPMVIDVQGWLDNPSTNYGYILIGDEANSTTARRFDSREGGSPPVLVVDYTSDEELEACCDPDDGSCTLTVVGSGTCGGNNTTLPGIDACLPDNPCPQPAGACCNVDNTCSDNTDKQMCENAGGTYVGGNCNQANCGLTPFVEALPIPPILQPDNPEEVAAGLKPKYTISVEEAVQSVHPDLPDTTLWTYNGAWPAATIVATKGEPIEVTYVNNLPTGGGNRGSNVLEVDTCSHGPNDWGDSKRISTHLHGGHLPARFDGQPEYTILPGETDVYQYPNNQDAATVWYHDHALGITRLNVYAGMAGFYLIRDDEDTLGLGDQTNALNLPSLQYEIGMAIQDRTFEADGSLFYNAQLEDAFKGEYAVVNGKINPYLMVDQGKYRFRILNGSQSREYNLRLENINDPGNDPSFTLIGTDLGLIDEPILLGNDIGLQGPAERMDVVIDFAGYPAGTEIILRNDDPTTPLLPSIMKFIVTDQAGHIDPLPSTLRTVTPLAESSADVTRWFRLTKESAQTCKDGSGRLVNEWLIESLDGPGGDVIGKHWDDISDFPVLGNREVWEFENPTNSYHPMHVHLVRFQILSKTDMTTGEDIPLQPWEINTWKDIVHVPANTRAKIIMDFEDYLGKFPTHCHLLDHEDHEMMRQFQTINPPSATCGNGTCDPGEDCKSCQNDCAQVSGAFCGNGLCEAGDGEDCVTCAEDCAGKAKGPFCCGNGGKNPIGCGIDASDDRCIDSRDNLYCRVTARVSACCGDAMCEGQEDVSGSDFCQIDCDPATCTPTGVPETVCNGVDDNCNIQIDEDYTPTSTSCGVGVCAASGSTTCNGGVEGDTCTPGTPGVEGPDGDATCTDGLDNDCDGLTDANDPDCDPVVCTPTGVSETICNGVDDNCNEEIDEDWTSLITSCGVGVCAANGNTTCNGGVEGDACTPGTPDESTEVSCDNSLDDDCDGFTDAADSDCQTVVDCGLMYNDRNSCKADPACQWKKNTCINR